MRKIYDLYSACREGDLLRAHSLLSRKLFSERLDPNLRYDNEPPVIFIAVEKGHPELVDLLIDMGADVNATMSAKLLGTPLMTAAAKGLGDIVEALLAAGAKVDAVDETGRTAIDDALSAGREEIVRTLLEKGASIYRPGEALISAVNSGRKDLVTLILDKGADINAEHRGNRTPLMVAVRPPASKEIVELLLAKGANPNAFNEWGQNALAVAAEHGDKEMIEILLAHGADINLRGDETNCPLNKAAQEGLSEMIDFLIDRGADPNAPGWTPLMSATVRGHLEAVERLVNRGADVNGVYERYTALAIAAEEGRLEIVKFLLTNGADPNLYGTGGRPPLREAAVKGYAEIVETLLSHNGDANIRDEDGVPLLERAASWKPMNRAVVDMLKSAGARIDEEAFLDKHVDNLIRSYTTSIYVPINDFRQIGGYLKDDPKASSIKLTGMSLYNLGGHDMMVRAHRIFAAKLPVYARNLEIVWDGIGEWRG